MRHEMPESRADSPATAVRQPQRALRIVRDDGRSAESSLRDEPPQHAARTMPGIEAKGAGTHHRSARLVAPRHAQNAATDIGP